MNEREAAAFGKAVGDATRQRILRYCCCQRRSVGDIADRVGVSQPTVSHHMSLLEKANLVERDQEGKTVYYGVKQDQIVACCGQLLVSLAPDAQATERIRDCC